MIFFIGQIIDKLYINDIHYQVIIIIEIVYLY